MGSGLSRDEEAAALYDQLSMPSVSTGDSTALRDRLTLGAPQATDPDSFMGRLMESGGRIASHPAVRSVLMGGPGAALIDYGARSGAQGLGLMPRDDAPPGASFDSPAGGFSPQFTRPGGDESKLIASPGVDVQPAPTLNPAYGQIGRSMSGGAPGSNGLKTAWEAAQKQQLASLGDQQRIEGDQGMSRVGRIEAVSQLEQQEAARQAEDAAWQQKIDDASSRKMQAFMDKNEQIATEIGKMAPDPSRLMRNADTGSQIMMALSAVAGGMLAGLNGGPNIYLDRIDKMIDRDIQAQNDAINNKKSELTARNTVFGQLLQETGDRRLAAQQTKQHILEAVKLRLKAQADSLGIPEVRANSEAAINITQQKIDDLNVNNTAAAWKTYQAQAAAAAAAQRAAEERQYQHMKDLMDFGLKKDALEIERGKVTGTAGKAAAEQAQQLAKDLANPEMIQNKVAVEGAMRRLIDPKTGKVDPNKGLPGVGPTADLRDKGFPRPTGLSALNPVDWAKYKALGLDSDERTSRQDYEQLKLGYRHLITGSGGGEKELADIGKSFDGAQTPQEQANAVQKLYDTVNRLEQTKKAGYDDATVDTVESRLRARGGAPMPSSVRVKK